MPYFFWNPSCNGSTTCRTIRPVYQLTSPSFLAASISLSSMAKAERVDAAVVADNAAPAALKRKFRRENIGHLPNCFRTRLLLATDGRLAAVRPIDQSMFL